MTRLDRLIQRWRIKKVGPFLSGTSRVLDIGCADGALFRTLSFLRNGTGIDPDLPADRHLENATLIAGHFPQNLPTSDTFDIITMLAVLEHLPASDQVKIAKNCYRYLTSGGKLIITVPSAFVDKILAVLKLLRLIDGIRIDQHYGYNASLTPGLFASAGFELVQARKFQLGLNNLFVFGKPANSTNSNGIDQAV